MSDWSVWDIKNPFLRILTAWIIVCMVIPPVASVWFIFNLIVCSFRQWTSYDPELDAVSPMSYFFFDLRMFFSKETWSDVWAAMTRWKQ